MGPYFNGLHNMSQTSDPARRVPWDDFDHDVRTARTMLRSVTETLHELIEDAIARKREGVKDLPLKAAELETHLKRAFEIERKFNDWLVKHTDALRPGEFDLRAALAEVESRLALLRDAHGDGTSPG